MDSKPLYGRGLVIDTYDQPEVLRDRPTTLAILRVEEGHRVSTEDINLFTRSWEKRSAFHRVLGGKLTQGGALEIILANAGTAGRDEDMGRIRSWLEERILPYYILPPHLTYSLYYWLDPERPTA